MKWIIFTIGLVIAFIILFVKIVKKIDGNKNEKHVLRFLINNPEKVSISIDFNNDILLDYQSNKKMPLASTLKVIIAVEFARQGELEKLDIEELIPLRELSKYYIKNTDGGAHEEWLNSLNKKGLITNNKVPLLEVAKGMIQFSSNANTEFLIERLGIDSINDNLKKISLLQHDVIYPLSSAMLICRQIELERRLTTKESIKELKDMSYTEYRKRANQIHELLSKSRGKQLINNLNTSVEHQLVLSNKQPRSTTREYVKLMKVIREGNILSIDGHRIIDEIMKITPSNNSKLNYLGLKGGSTISILNLAFYSGLKNGDTMDGAIFIHDPNCVDILWLQDKLELFLGKFINNEEFQKETIKTLKRTM